MCSFILYSNYKNNCTLFISVVKFYTKPDRPSTSNYTDKVQDGFDLSGKKSKFTGYGLKNKTNKGARTAATLT